MKDREYIVTVLDEEFYIFAPEYEFNRARYLGCREYKRIHPEAKITISSLMRPGKAKVRVVKDMRIKKR